MNITVSGILSYPNLHRAVTLENYPNNPPKFRCTVLLKKGSADLKKIENMLERLKQEKWKGKAPFNFELKCLIDLINDPITSDYVALKALNSEDNKPRVLDQNGEEIITPSQLTAGMLCQMSVSLYVYTKSGNGVSAGINGVKLSGGMGELGLLGRGRLSDEEMFGPSSSSEPPFVIEPVVKKYIMTDTAKAFGWKERSDVTGDWNNDKLLIEHGYMIEAPTTVRSDWY